MGLVDCDTIVVGGGLLGSAVAFGLMRAGADVAVLDEGDVAFRASVGNFGLVWVQSKGDGLPDYARWTRRSADLWPAFATELTRQTGVDLGFRQPGGLQLCLSEEELERGEAFLRRMHNQIGAGGYEGRLIDRAETEALVPAIGPKVLGAIYCPQDGHVNPLLLLRALRAAGQGGGVRYLPGDPVTEIKPQGGGYRIRRANGTTLNARRVVLAAGLGNAALAQGLGKTFPVKPQRGQIIVTQRTKRFLDLPVSTVRQSEEGTVMIGDSKEDAGFNLSVRPEVSGTMARRAIRAFPHLAEVPVVRTWSALRVMSPDGFPVYQTWDDLPGLYALGCHSGVTLAAAHAEVLAPAIAANALPPETLAFRAERFDVQSHAAA